MQDRKPKKRKVLQVRVTEAEKAAIEAAAAAD